MGRQDEQAGIVARHQRHHRIVESRRHGRCALGSAPVSIVERGFVAMVAVGDQYRRGFERSLHDRNLFGSLDRAQLVANSEVVRGIEQGLARRDLRAQPLERGIRARVEAEDRADIDARRRKQLEPVFLCRWKGFLMRQNSSRREFLEPKPHDETRARKVPVLDLEPLRVEIDRGMLSAPQHALVDPLPKRAARRRIPVRITSEFEPHDIVRASLVKAFLERIADYVVGWGDYPRYVSDLARVVKQSAQRFYSRTQTAHSNASPASAAAI